MILVRTYGGLGNQMFQYAFAKTYALKFNKILIIDNLSGFGKHDEYNRDFSLDQFDLNDDLLSDKLLLKYFIGNKYFWSIGRRIGFIRKEYDITKYDEKYIGKENKKYLDGYWHSPKYFDECKSQIINLFKVDHVESNAVSSNIKLIEKTNNSVAIGLRFFQEVSIYGIHSVLGKDYYKRAISLMQSKLKKPHFLIFSNDNELAEEFFEFLDNKTIIDPIKDNRGAIYDLFLMSRCENFIISNSTFHWWGAYIGETGDSIVTAPKNGYYNKDMMCEHWVKI